MTEPITHVILTHSLIQWVQGRCRGVRLFQLLFSPLIYHIMPWLSHTDGKLYMRAKFWHKDVMVSHLQERTRNFIFNQVNPATSTWHCLMYKFSFSPHNCTTSFDCWGSLNIPCRKIKWVGRCEPFISPLAFWRQLTWF